MSFLNRLVNARFTQGKDFRGISPMRMTQGKFFYWLQETNLFFPEIIWVKVEKVKGMNITIVDYGKNWLSKQGFA